MASSTYWTKTNNVEQLVTLDAEKTPGRPSATVCVFDINTLGVETNQWFEVMKPSFYQLEDDKYDQKRQQVELLRLRGFHVAADADLARTNLPAEIREAIDAIRPTRQREIVKFIARFDGPHEADVRLRRVPAAVFQQQVEDDRGKTRVFREMKDSIAYHPQFLQFINGTLHRLLRPHMNQTQLDGDVAVTIHQVRQVCYPDQESHNSPEGIHRDGADFIISACVVNRENVVGGISTVFFEDKQTKVYRVTLQEGQGLFHEDRKLWHYVEPIRCVEGAQVGYRDIIGFDIQFIPRELESWSSSGQA